MAKSGVGRIARRRSDGKYFIYVPLEVANDTSFPLQVPSDEISRVVSIEINEEALIIKKHEKQ